MKILYAIQGTGNGHISRALEIIPHLQQRGEVDILISSSQWNISFPHPIKYRYKGLGFVFGKKGGVDILKTYLQIDSMQLIREIKHLPVHDYHLVISDFEPVSCWASQFQKKVCIGLSNQAASLHPLAAKPRVTDKFGKFILEHYAPVSHNYGFHFKKFDENVNTPIIRKVVRDAEISNKGHITVYLPAMDDDRIVKKLNAIDRDVKWEVFNKHAKTIYKKKNVTVLPLNNQLFINSMASSDGVFCNAGFGTASEALFLGKKLMVIPMKTQYEQQCNAAVLKSMGVGVVKSLKEKHFEKIQNWIESGVVVPVNYPDQTAELVDKIITRHAGQKFDDDDSKTNIKNFKRIIGQQNLAATF